MVSASKILTVSYGTFSCTLEGFDEPFSTMKAIAEYFRDLAADDRYFGAEPPTPDAEMLHRIAEREIQRRVEAKINEHGIVLRQTEEEPAPQPRSDMAPATAIAVAEVPAAADLVAEASAPEPATAEPEGDTVEPEEAPASEAVAATTKELLSEDVAPSDAAVAFAPDSISAKLERIRAVVSEARSQAEPTDYDALDGDAATAFAPAAAHAGGDFGFDLDLGDALPVESAEATAEDAPDASDIAEQDWDEATLESPEAPDLRVPVPEEETDDTEQVFVEETASDEVEVASDESVAPAVEAHAEEAIEAADESVSDLEAEVVDATGGNEQSALDMLRNMPGVQIDQDGEDDVETAEADLDDFEDDTDLVDFLKSVSGDAEPEELDETAAPEDTAALDDDAETFAEAETEHLHDEADEAEAEQLATDAESTELPVQIDEQQAASVENEDVAVEEVAEDRAPALDLSAYRIDADIEAPQAAEDAPADMAEAAPERPGFFERARVRVIKIRKSEASREQAAGTDNEVVETSTDSSVDETTRDDQTLALEDQANGTQSLEETDEPAAHTEAESQSEALFAALSEDDTDIESDELYDAEPEDTAAAEDEIAAKDEDEDEDEDAALLSGISSALGQSGLDDEDEQELLRELSEVARESRRDSHEGRAILEKGSEDGDASVERLMEEAKSKLEGDESRRRFSAIAHLKAAVAATVADRKLRTNDGNQTSSDDETVEINRYRDDLSKAVRPRRPAAEASATTRRPTLEPRTAPLVLVSEQRIDSAEQPARDAAAIRPRRIAGSGFATEGDDYETTESISPNDASSFAEFAEQLGATTLPELLEAAAAYTQTVEGQPHFSRPQILSRALNAAEDEDYSREDGLRSFGMLLRQGKIQKISRGQFMITESSKFMSEARRASR